MSAMKAEEEYVPALEDEREDILEKIDELAEDQTEEEDVEELAEREPDRGQLEMVRRAGIVSIVRDLLQQHTVEPERMNVLTAQETSALEYLKAAIEGRTTGGRFMYAEDRLNQLNLVLADLQPLMAVGGMEGLDQTLGEIVDEIDELRQKLELLEEAQEEIHHADEEKKKDKPDEGDEDDKPDEEGEGAEGEGEGEEKAEAAPAESATKNETQTPAKPAGLWARLTGRGKKDEGGGGGGTA